jgi:hypothetical protein
MTPLPASEIRSAGEPIDADDLRALATIRAIYRASDPAPSDLADRAKFAMTVAALEAEIAEITSSEHDLAGVRSTVYERAATITFSSDHLSAMITIEVMDGGTARISGWVTSPPVWVELRERSRTQSTTTDTEGRFSFGSAERGLVHLVFRRTDAPEERPVITPAIEI